MPIFLIIKRFHGNLICEKIPRVSDEKTGEK